MRARLFRNILRAGSVARDYVRLAISNHDRTAKDVDNPKSGQAKNILESFYDSNVPEYNLDVNINGSDLIQQLDQDLEYLGFVPYHFSKAAKEAGDEIGVGSPVSIPEDDRQFQVVTISERNGSVRIRDTDGGYEYIVPWQLVRPDRG